MFVFNKTSQWLESLPDDERESVLKDSIKDGRKIREKYIERLREIENNRKVKLRGKQIAPENKQRNLLKKRSKNTKAVLYYGLWQNTEDADKILDELKGLAEKKKAILAQLRFRQNVLKQSVSDKKLFQMSEKNKAYLLEKLRGNLKKINSGCCRKTIGGKNKS